MKRTDFRPSSKGPSSLSEKDRKIIQSLADKKRNKEKYYVAVKLKTPKKTQVFQFNTKSDAKGFIKDVKKYPNVTYAVGRRNK